MSKFWSETEIVQFWCCVMPKFVMLSNMPRSIKIIFTYNAHPFSSFATKYKLLQFKDHLN